MKAEAVKRVLNIHNYFFAKAIDQVRPGGIVAFVTSRYTLDSKDSAARKHIAERADLLGAIRLPNNAFRANAGTDVVSDIIFLQKRDRPMDHEPAWVQLGKTADGIAINSYFADHPEMILGKLTTENTQYGKEEATVVPIEGANLADQLREAVQQLEGQYLEAAAEVPDIAETEAERRTLPADPDVKNFSYTVVEGDAQNPDKTEQGQLVSSYKCSPLTVDEEFMLSKRQYELVTGRRQKNDVIAYQIRQSFKPGEITAEEANKVGYELAMSFTKGKYAFLVATHTDREHIHNHIIYNSTALDCSRKFRDFLLSGLAVQRLSDLICLEHSLSVIEIKPYRERQKRVLYPPKESNRDQLCGVIDSILADKPGSYEEFLKKLEQQGYEVKRGKITSVKGVRQKRFTRFRTLGAGYSEEELKAVLAGEAEHCPRKKHPVQEQKFQMLVDIQAKLAEGKGDGYARWAKRYNLKEMSKTMIFLQENKIGSMDEMEEQVRAATMRYHELGDSIKAAEARMAEIAVMKTHIINYAKTRSIYETYRKAGYSKRFLEANRESIALHKAAKAAFDEAGLKKLPKVKELSIEYVELLKKKKAEYPSYRKARERMQELMKAQKNVEMFFADNRSEQEQQQTR